MKRFWGSLVIGIVLLAGVVAFALLPGSGGTQSPPGPEGVAVGATDEAAALACRSFLLGTDRSGIDAVLNDISEALVFERQGHDGGMGFHDWFEADDGQQSLLQVADAGGAAARTPGLDDATFTVFREVAGAAADLERQTVSSSVFVTGDVESTLIDLTTALSTARNTCA